MSVEDVQIAGARLGHVNQFNSPEEEIAFLKHKLSETQTEFTEFQESSRELETEYETQVKQLENKNNEYKSQLGKLEIENDQLKAKYAVYMNDTQHKLNEYQEQLAEIQALNARLTSYIRELEQNNDDLERARRALAASLEDFESQLNQQIERNVLLENEVSEKVELECVVQRLKEETRDLKHELNVHSKQSDSTRRKQLILDHHLALKQAESPAQSTVNSKGGSSIAETGQIDDEIASASIILANGSIQAVQSVTDLTTSQPQSPACASFTLETFDGRSTEPPLLKKTDTKSQQTSAEPSPTRPAVALTPSSRISALNIVSDLLRKVISLESKLSTAKKVTN